ncbi:lecithin retinol acyltransferase family protein [Aeromonas salmonicida]
MSSPRPGDHLVSSRPGFHHHGLYLGEQQVIHYLGFSAGELSGQIAVTSLAQFCQSNDYQVVPHAMRCYSHEQSIDRAFSRLGEAHYNTVFNNCEHFVRWCIDGFHYSKQIQELVAAGMLAQRTAKTLLAPPHLPTALVRTQRQAQSLPVPAPMVMRVQANPTLPSTVGSNAASVAASLLLATSTAPLTTTLAGGTLAYLTLRRVWHWLKD